MTTDGQKLVYPSLGVLEAVGEFADPHTITQAIMPHSGAIRVDYTDGSSETFDVNENAVDYYSAGSVKFTTRGGQEYLIRPVQAGDGAWLSEYGAILPVPALKTLAQNQEN